MSGHTKWAETKRPARREPSLYWRVRSWWRWHAWPVVRRPHRPVIYRWHRSTHGWARPDTWGLDDYLCQLIGESVAFLRDNGNSYPMELDPHPDAPFNEEKHEQYAADWQAILTRISGPLLAYRSHWDWPDGQPVTEHMEHEKKIMSEAQDALRLMADWLPSLWD